MIKTNSGLLTARELKELKGVYETRDVLDPALKDMIENNFNELENIKKYIIKMCIDNNKRLIDYQLTMIKEDFRYDNPNFIGYGEKRVDRNLLVKNLKRDTKILKKFKKQSFFEDLSGILKCWKLEYHLLEEEKQEKFKSKLSRIKDICEFIKKDSRLLKGEER